MSNNKYEIFLNNLFNHTPEFMKINEDNEIFLILDRFVVSLNENAMPWLFKVYLEQQYKILKNNKFTLSIRNKYSNLNPKVIDFNGNLFFNLDGLCVILKELEEVNQVIFNEVDITFNLV